MRFALAATESFSRRNANASVDEARGRSEQVLARAREDGVRSTVTISVAFGCPFEGRVDPAKVVELASRLSSADEVVLADTIGVATPKQVRGLIEESAAGASTATTRATRASPTRTPRSRAGRRRSTPRSAASAVARSRRKATGNIATEDLVYMLEGDGIETGVDLDALIGIRSGSKPPSAGSSKGRSTEPELSG